MPRPKRTKVAPSVPAPRGRKVSKPVAEDTELSQAPQDALNDLYDISDPDEGKNGMGNARKSKRKGKAVAEATIFTQSRVPKTGTGSPAVERMSIAVEMSGALPAMPSEESLLPEIDLESSSPSMEIGRRDASATRTENSVLALGNFRRRPRQPSVLGRGGARARSSSVDSNLAEDNGLMSVGKKNSTKRRPREQSRAGRNTIRSSSMGLDMNRATPAVGSALRLGNFKRRAREPSLLRTAQKERPQPTDFDLEDDENFSPDDESTPLNLSKSKTMVMSSAGSSSSRKRKLSAVQVPQSQTPHSSPPRRPVPALPENTEEQGDTVPASVPLASEDDDEEHDDLERVTRSPSQELPMPSVEARPITPEPFSETNAPPQSSSSAPESPPPPPRASRRQQAQQEPSRGRRQLRNRTPLQIDEASPPSSPPSLTHSPNRPATRQTPKARTRKEPPPASTLSTAALQALLPRRRRQATRDPFDIVSEDEIDVSGLASDDDELTHSTIRAPPRRNNQARPTSLRKPTKLKPATTAKKGRKITYGRNVTSDKENDEAHDPDDSLGPLPDDADASLEGTENSQALEERVGKELKMAARKFKEVDKWEMEFEECTASSSSQHDAR